MRTTYFLFLAILLLPIFARGEGALPRGEQPEERVQVARPQPDTCDASAWQSKGRLRPLLRPQKVVRSDKLIVDFDLKSISPGATREGQGGILDARALDVFMGCSDGPDGRGIAAGTRVLDPVSGLAIEVTAVESAGKSGRGWLGSRCGLRIADPDDPSRYFEVPMGEVPAFNQPAGLVRDGDRVYLQLQFNGYAKEIKGQGNLIIAGDLCGHRLAWRSPNLVSNAPLLVLGEYLITGYGFTKEADWLFVLDRRTGKVIQKLSLPKAPEAMRATESQLFVRLYDGYAVFALCL